MHAHLTSVRLAPKKANIVAKMVRGMPVPDAVELLRRTSKKGARLIEGVLLSAMANASHNFKQNSQSMIVKTIIVNQGTAYRRGTPMARGRVRPLRKFMCHISITLGYPEGSGAEGKIEKRTERTEKTGKTGTKKTEKAPFKTAKNTVKSSGSDKPKAKASPAGKKSSQSS